MLLVLFAPAAVLVGCTQKIDEAPAMKAADEPADQSSGATVTIAPGTRVVWVNHDDVPHTATSTGKPRRFDTGALDTDQKYAHVFTEPGTYNYFCAVHPKMTGQIIVK